MDVCTPIPESPAPVVAGPNNPRGAPDTGLVDDVKEPNKPVP